MRRRIKEYGFEAGTDYSPVVVKSRGRPRKDYLLTRDMAKELAMIERTDVGRQTRRKVRDLGEVPINPHSWRRNIPSPSVRLRATLPASVAIPMAN